MTAFLRRLMFASSAAALFALASAAPDAPNVASSGAALPLEGFTGVGVMLVKNNRLDRLGWSEAQIKAFLEGVGLAMRGQKVSYDDATRIVGSDMIRRVQQLDAAPAPIAGGFDQPGRLQSYLKDVKKRLRMQETDSGLLYFLKTTGRGARPTAGDTIVVTLVGSDGASDEPLPQISGENVRIKLDDLLPGLREGVQMLAVGSEAIFVLPPDLSFAGDEWPSGVGRGMPLTFLVTLHEVINGTK